MAREFKGKLTADDLVYLRQRYPESYVQRQVDLYGVAKSADSEDEVKAAAEAARKAQEEADAKTQADAEAAQREADEAAAEAARKAQEEADAADGEDLIGSTAYDVIAATEAEVKEWAAKASAEDKAAALATEQAREDRDPRKGVVSLLS